MQKTYSELIKFETFRDRFMYLKLSARVGEITFGYDRYMNQMLYKSRRWLAVRDEVILRDECRDLGVPFYDIFEKVIVHHMNPITLLDIEEAADHVFNPEYLICVSNTTHNALHFGKKARVPFSFAERSPNDTSPWLKFANS